MNVAEAERRIAEMGKGDREVLEACATVLGKTLVELLVEAEDEEKPRRRTRRAR